MVCLKRHDKSSNMRRTQLLVNLHWLLIDLRIDFKIIFLPVFVKKNLLLNWNENLHLKHFPLGVYETAFIYVFILGLDWQTWSTFTGFKLLSRKTLQHQWEWSRYWIHLHKIDRSDQMQSTPGGGGSCRRRRCRNCRCLQRCWICIGRVRYQRMAPYQNMCK